MSFSDGQKQIGLNIHHWERLHKKAKDKVGKKKVQQGPTDEGKGIGFGHDFLQDDIKEKAQHQQIEHHIGHDQPKKDIDGQAALPEGSAHLRFPPLPDSVCDHTLVNSVVSECAKYPLLQIKFRNKYTTSGRVSTKIKSVGALNAVQALRFPFLHGVFLLLIF